MELDHLNSARHFTSEWHRAAISWVTKVCFLPLLNCFTVTRPTLIQSKPPPTVQICSISVSSTNCFDPAYNANFTSSSTRPVLYSRCDGDIQLHKPWPLTPPHRCTGRVLSWRPFLLPIFHSTSTDPFRQLEPTEATASGPQPVFVWFLG